MSLQALSDYVVYSKYSHYLPEKKRRETWEEITDRVFGMHAVKYKKELEENKEFSDMFEAAKDAVKKKRVLGSQRALQFASPDPKFGILNKNEKIFNCTSTLVDRPRAFQEIGYVLLNGCGAGYSVQYHHIEKLPSIKKPTKGKKIYRPEDKIEGWSECWGVLINSFFENGIYPEYEGYDVEFDLSEIRPAGALIAGQFKAPGPQPLEKSLSKIKCLINSVLDKGETRLSSLNVHDIICHIADAIISGGVRRSALICLFSLEDKEMRECKTGSWFVENAQRGRANNSVVLERGKVTKEQFNEIFENLKLWGEPGFYFVDDGAIHQSTNPSLKKGTLVLTKDGPRQINNLQDKDFEVYNLRGGYSKATCRLSSPNAELYKVKLQSGFEYFATKEHRWATNEGEKTTIELKTGDRLPILKKNKVFNGNLGDYKDGFIIGWLLGDGWVTVRGDNGRNQFGFIVSEEKYNCGLGKKLLDFLIEKTDYTGTFLKREKSSLKPWYEINTQNLVIEKFWKKFYSPTKDAGLARELLEEASEEFIVGLIDAYGSTDGSFQPARYTFVSKNCKFLQDISEILGFYGIRTALKKTVCSDIVFPNGKNYNKEYTRYDLVVSDIESKKFFAEKFSISHPNKQVALDYWKNRERKNGEPINYMEVVLVEKTDIKEPVWDITVFDSDNCFSLSHCVTHNCCEIGFWPISESGQSGFGFCNLCEINGLECKTKEEFLELCKHAAFIGTLQAGYNSTPYLGKATEDILRKEALLGVSITGWMDSPNTLFNEENLKAGVEVVKEINEKVAKVIGVNPAARTTCTKPSGTASSVLMTGSGIHAQHSRKFLRRAQVNKKEFAGKIMKKKNKCAVVESVYSPNKTDNVISFPCEVNPEAIVKGDLSAIGFLEKVKLAYQNWVLPGTYADRGLNKAVTHNISVTVNVGDDEWDGARDYIFENRGYFSGISLLSRQGDLIYDQAPFAEVLDPKELVERYGDAVPLASGLIVDGLHSFDNLWTACETALGTRKIDEKADPVEPKKPRKSRGMKEKEYASALANYAIELNLYYQDKGEYETIEHKKDWVRRAKQFAERYFNNDMTKMTYCLKHVSLWKDWLDIKREWKDIDWANIKENDQEYVDADTMAGASCSGGACEVLK